MTTNNQRGDEGRFDCELVAAWFHDAAADTLYSESAVEAVAHHVASCAACRELAAGHEAEDQGDTPAGEVVALTPEMSALLSALVDDALKAADPPAPSRPGGR